MHLNNKLKVVEDVSNKIKDWKYKFWFIGGDWRSLALVSDLGARLNIPMDFEIFWSKLELV